MGVSAPATSSVDADGEPRALDAAAFEAAFHLSTEAAAFIDAEGTILMANPALAHLVGREPHTLGGMSVDALFAPGGARSGKQIVRHALTWNEFEMSAVLAGANGARVDADVTARLFVAAEGERLVQLTARDARARRQNETLHALALAASRATNAATDASELGAGVLTELAQALPSPIVGALFVHDQTADALAAIADTGLGTEWRTRHGVQPLASGSESLIAYACQRRESIFVLDASLEPPPHHTALPDGVVSIVAVPLVANDAMLGGILVASSDDTRLDFDALHAVEVAAAEATSGLMRLDAAARLASAETQLRAVVGSIRDGLVVTDRAGHVLEANTAVEDLFGWRDGPPRTLADAFGGSEESAQAFLARVRRLHRATEYVATVVGDRLRHLRVHGAVTDGRPERVVILVEDATDEVRVSRFREFDLAWGLVGIRAMPGTLPAAELASAARAAAAASGARYLESRPGAPARVVAEDAADGAFDVADEEAFDAWIEERLAAGAPDVRAWPRGGGLDDAHVTVLPAVDGDRVVGAIVLAQPHRDGAAFSRADAERLAVAAANLSRVVQHHLTAGRVRSALAREREAIARVRRLNQEIEEFTLWTTHDLREPLRSLATLAAYLRADMGDAEDPESAALAQQISQAAELLKTRVMGLHDFSVLARADAPVVEQDLGNIVAAVLADRRELVEERGARVHVAPDLPRLRAQANRLGVVVANLLENAIKYADPAAPEVWVEAEDGADSVVLAVEDNGGGVPEALRERVFHPFFRAPEHAGVAGTGTGLAIVRRVVAQHGGTVHVEDGRRGGARFVVELPRAPAGADAVA